MPKGTPVHRLYEKFLARGDSKATAAKKAQAATGKSLKTGKKPKKKR